MMKQNTNRISSALMQSGLVSKVIPIILQSAVSFIFFSSSKDIGPRRSVRIKKVFAA